MTTHRRNRGGGAATAANSRRVEKVDARAKRGRRNGSEMSETSRARKEPPRLTVNLLVGTVLVYLVLAEVAWPVVWHNATTLLRTDLDKAVIADEKGSGDVTRTVRRFMEPATRFEHIVQRLWDLGFESEKTLGTYIYRRREAPGHRGPDERWRSIVKSHNEQLDEAGGEYMAKLRRIVPGGVLHEYSITVNIIARTDNSTVWKATKRKRIRMPNLWD